MASTPFELDDQTDEDFFDKLVNDDIDFSVSSTPSAIAEASAIANLSISEVKTSERIDSVEDDSSRFSDGLGEINLDSLDSVVAKEKELSVAENESRGSELESESGKVKLVQWDSFGSDSSKIHGRDGTGYGSYSDLFNGIGESSDDPFANVGEGDKLGVQSSAKDVALDSSSGFERSRENSGELNVNGAGYGSYSDLFNGIGESSDDPFANVGEGDKLGVQSSAKDVALDSSSGFEQSRENSRELNVNGARYGSYSDLFNGLGESSDDPFVNVGEGDKSVVQSNVKDGSLDIPASDLGSSGYEQRRENSQELNVNGQDLNSTQYWESVYPGWKYDHNTGQWYQLEGHDANANANANADASGNVSSSVNMEESFLASNSFALDQRSDSYHLEQTAASSVAGNVSDWSQVSRGSTEYPAHMVFDPQYPGWYYDTISQEWKSLDSYAAAVDNSKGVDNNQQVHKNEQSYGSQSLASQDGVTNWDGSLSSYNQQNTSTWQTQQTAQSVNIGYAGSQQLGNQYAMKDYGTVNHQTESSQGLDGGFGVSAGFQSANSAGSFTQLHYQTKEEKSQETHFLPAQFNSLNVALFPSQPVQSQSSSTFSYAGSIERTSAKRPPHALVTFGFGGKLVVMKDVSSLHTNSAYGSQDSRGGVINVLNLMEVITEKTDTLGYETGARDYFRALCQQSFPGPLVGGNAGSKELNKWIDDKIANYETSNMDYRKGDILRLLLSLLKISVQYYGKLRSPFGSDQILKENDSPEAAVAKLFASAKRNQEYGAFMQCLQNIPSEAQVQATALEVQNLLVSGRKKEALESAQEGQLWGPALVLASQLGDQFYSETVKKMALKQLIAGSPLRTLCLLIAGQPADVFSDTSSQSSVQNSLNVLQQPSQLKANCTLDEWTQNLAIITANRTKDDELVIIHLGDCLWKETGEITAAHICYLVAEANFEPHSESSRLCLIGADHWKFPRTYASPEAIQRTELYEYSKVLGNSQFLLLPFQPYKLVYAHMLAEVGKISDSLKYCQTMLRSLKTGRAPEVEAWKQLVLSLEERIKTHQQGGYGTNLASTKLVGKLLTFFDSTAHRVVGGLPPPVPSNTHVSAQPYEPAQQLGLSGVSNSQSAMAMPLLMPSASMEPISASGSDDLTMPNRSISEPDFSRSPRKVDSSKKENFSNAQDKTSVPTGSRFGRFGSQLFQKTVGLVIRSRPDKQAKLGEPNSFYYDEKLKRWVEKGAEPPPEQEALAPPPTIAPFQSGMQPYSMKGSSQPERFDTVASPEIKSPSPPENSLGIPPIPPGSNQFSARGRIGVRSRYVDTFNKGGGARASTNLFQSPSAPAAKPAGGSNPKFFIPAAVTSSEPTVQPDGESLQEATITENNSSPLLKDDPFSSAKKIPTPTPTPTPPTNMQRFPSMDTIVSRSGEMARGNSPLPPHARRTASWSGSLPNSQSPPVFKEIRPLGEALGISPSMYMPNNPPTHLRRNSGSFGDELHEVQL